MAVSQLVHIMLYELLNTGSATLMSNDHGRNSCGPQLTYAYLLNQLRSLGAGESSVHTMGKPHYKVALVRCC